jgi:uncharacterized protein YyaL (SSP411 family)
MKEKELIAAINGLNIPGVKATRGMKMEELQNLHTLLTAPKSEGEAAEQLKAANERIAELEAANAELVASAEELSKALEKSETTKPTEKNGVEVKHAGKTYRIVRGGATVIDGERVEYTPEDCAKNEELMAHLVKIGATNLKFVK